MLRVIDPWKTWMTCCMCGEAIWWLASLSPNRAMLGNLWGVRYFQDADLICWDLWGDVTGAHDACGQGIQRHAVCVLLQTISQEVFKVTMIWCGSQSPCCSHLLNLWKPMTRVPSLRMFGTLTIFLLPARSANRNLRIWKTSWKSRQRVGAKKGFKMFEEPLAL